MVRDNLKELKLIENESEDSHYSCFLPLTSSLKLLLSPTPCLSFLPVILPFVSAWKFAIPLIFLTQSAIGDVFQKFDIPSLYGSVFTNPLFPTLFKRRFFYYSSLEHYVFQKNCKCFSFYTNYLTNIPQNIFSLPNSNLNTLPKTSWTTFW